MLANRVKKNAKHLKKWARRSDVSCYRLYDRDIPEIPLVIDWYEGHLHFAEYARGGSEEREEWIVDEWAFAVAQALEVDVQQVFIKARRRQRGLRQYERHAETQHTLVVHEGGLKFRVNLQDYLDTGLFLDHRITRDLVRAESDGCAVLNLFAYTGSFSVYAADGGASTTTTIDLSKTYLSWARENLRLNGFDLEQHTLIHADVLRWCEEQALKGPAFDLIILDPPTFSNSKRAEGTFDVQRDHEPLIDDALSLLRPGGILWFSTNARRFKLSPKFADNAVEMTHRTTPNDFKRPMHKSWRMEKV